MGDAQGRSDAQQGGVREPPARISASPVSYAVQQAARRAPYRVAAMVVVAGVLLGAAVALLIELL